MLFIKEHLIQTKLKPKYISDDNLVTIKLIIHNRERGKGYWKLNRFLWGKADYTKIVKNITAETTKRETEAITL